MKVLHAKIHKILTLLRFKQDIADVFLFSDALKTKFESHIPSRVKNTFKRMLKTMQ